MQLIKQVKRPLSTMKKVSLVSMVLDPETENAVSPELTIEHVISHSVGKRYLNISACGY